MMLALLRAEADHKEVNPVDTIRKKFVEDYGEEMLWYRIAAPCDGSGSRVVSAKWGSATTGRHSRHTSEEVQVPLASSSQSLTTGR